MFNIIENIYALFISLMFPMVVYRTQVKNKLSFFSRIQNPLMKINWLNRRQTFIWCGLTCPEMPLPGRQNAGNLMILVNFLQEIKII